MVFFDICFATIRSRVTIFCILLLIIAGRPVTATAANISRERHTGVI